MLSRGVVRSEIELVIEFFRTRPEAERMLAEVVRDEPNWQERFYIERIESAQSRRFRGAAHLRFEIATGGN